MSRIKKAVAAALIGCVLLSLVGFGGKCADIRQKVVRIHVLANSDSTEDQQLKLRVRDAVLSAADGLTEGCADREEALSVLAAHCPELKKAAEDCLKAEQSRIRKPSLIALRLGLKDKVVVAHETAGDISTSRDLTAGQSIL